MVDAPRVHAVGGKRGVGPDREVRGGSVELGALAAAVHDLPLDTMRASEQARRRATSPAATSVRMRVEVTGSPPSRTSSCATTVNPWSAP